MRISSTSRSRVATLFMLVRDEARGREGVLGGGGGAISCRRNSPCSSRTIDSSFDLSERSFSYCCLELFDSLASLSIKVCASRTDEAWSFFSLSALRNAFSIFSRVTFSLCSSSVRFLRASSRLNALSVSVRNWLQY